MGRVPRTAEDMLEALRRRIKLRRVYRRLAFDEGDRDYWVEIAGKLRLLLLPVGSNKPLLTLLLEEYQPGAEVFVLSGVSLSEFLNQSGLAVSNRKGTSEPCLTNADLINVWATQHGAAHEDWTLTESFDLLRPRTPDETDLLRVAASHLALITDAALEAAEQLFARRKGGVDGQSDRTKVAQRPS
jgi:hypothetical protein